MNLELEQLYLNPAIYVARSDTHRWGVFTSEDIKAFDVLQESPYCTFPEEEVEYSDVLSRYTYASDGQDGVDELVLGFGFAGLYNHSFDDSNARYVLDTVNEVMRHYATEDIPAGSEILLNYGIDDEEDFGDY